LPASANLVGYLLVAREVTPRMLAAGAGRIVNISVSESTMRRAGFVPYGPYRAGSEALSRIMHARNSLVWRQTGPLAVAPTTIF
jgi:NAD(P)-dependent dehydrogenase (short-subunit alcohol dehydrogenase family)